MYKDLMIDLDLCARGEKTGYHDVELCGLAYSAIKSLTAQLATLQAENAELREENGCLQHNVAAMQATLDQQAKNCEVLLAEKDKEIKAYEIIMKTMPAQRDEAIYRMKAAEATLARVEAERDAAQKCIYDVETYLELGSGAYIVKTIQAWKNDAQGDG